MKVGIWKSPSGRGDDQGFGGIGEHCFIFRGEMILREGILAPGGGRGPSPLPSSPRPESHVPSIVHVHPSLHPQDYSTPLKASLPLGQRALSEMQVLSHFPDQADTWLLLVLFHREYGKLRTPAWHLQLYGPG